MNEQMLQRVKIDGDVAILLNYTINDDLKAFFEYAHNLGLNKYAICDVFGTRYVLTANGLKGVPLVEYGLISDHITTETPEEIAGDAITILYFRLSTSIFSKKCLICLVLLFFDVMVKTS